MSNHRSRAADGVKQQQQQQQPAAVTMLEREKNKRAENQCLLPLVKLVDEHFGHGQFGTARLRSSAQQQTGGTAGGGSSLDVRAILNSALVKAHQTAPFSLLRLIRSTCHSNEPDIRRAALVFWTQADMTRCRKALADATYPMDDYDRVAALIGFDLGFAHLYLFAHSRLELSPQCPHATARGAASALKDIHTAVRFLLTVITAETKFLDRLAESSLRGQDQQQAFARSLDVHRHSVSSFLGADDLGDAVCRLLSIARFLELHCPFVGFLANDGAKLVVEQIFKGTRVVVGTLLRLLSSSRDRVVASRVLVFGSSLQSVFRFLVALTDERSLGAVMTLSPEEAETSRELVRLFLQLTQDSQSQLMRSVAASLVALAVHCDWFGTDGGSSSSSSFSEEEEEARLLSIIPAEALKTVAPRALEGWIEALQCAPGGGSGDRGDHRRPSFVKTLLALKNESGRAHKRNFKLCGRWYRLGCLAARLRATTTQSASAPDAPSWRDAESGYPLECLRVRSLVDGRGDDASLGDLSTHDLWWLRLDTNLSVVRAMISAFRLWAATDRIVRLRQFVPSGLGIAEWIQLDRADGVRETRASFEIWASSTSFWSVCGLIPECCGSGSDKGQDIDRLFSGLEEETEAHWPPAPPPPPPPPLSPRSRPTPSNGQKRKHLDEEDGGGDSLPPPPEQPPQQLEIAKRSRLEQERQQEDEPPAQQHADPAVPHALESRARVFRSWAAKARKTEIWPFVLHLVRQFVGASCWLDLVPSREEAPSSRAVVPVPERAIAERWLHLAWEVRGIEVSREVARGLCLLFPMGELPEAVFGLCPHASLSEFWRDQFEAAEAAAREQDSAQELVEELVADPEEREVEQQQRAAAETQHLFRVIEQRALFLLEAF